MTAIQAGEGSRHARRDWRGVRGLHHADARGAATTERLAPVLDHLKVVFGVHVEVTETTGGLYEEILEIAPRLANKIARFKREHVSISKAIRSSLDDLPDDGLPSPD